ncbi:hypothetical protein MJ561_16765 [Klebsiella pneumoniae]|nr:hypothetical protein MJ561_16765 [Klebsiella pneumoniae]
MPGVIAPGRGEKMPEAIGKEWPKMFRFIYRASHKTKKILGAAAIGRCLEITPLTALRMRPTTNGDPMAQVTSRSARRRLSAATFAGQRAAG